MNEPETKSTNSPDEVAELKEQCAGLERRLTLVLLGLVLCSLTVTGFVGLQVRRIGKDLDAVRPQARQVAEASAKEMPVVQTFMTKLTDYGKTHPDFQPIVTKFGLTTNAVAALGTKK
jgi:hypothetical protein